jgi:multiple sugar transport system permease protein
VGEFLTELSPFFKEWNKMRARTRNTIAFYLMISPWLIIFLALYLYPMVYGLYLSLTNFFGFNMDHLKFVGFHNYHTVFTDSDALSSMGRTFVITALGVLIGTPITFGLALLLSQNVRGSGTFRTIFYLPSVLPIVSTMLMWGFMFDRDGILNSVLGLFHVPGVNWLDYDHITASLMIVLLWGTGASLLITLAGLKAIPKELYEAASIDGASSFRRIFRITIPLMTPIIFFNIVTAMIGSLQLYLQPVLLTGSNPGNGFLSRPIQPIYLYGVHAFQQIFAFQRFAYGMALLWVLFVVILALSVVMFTTSKYWVYYETEQGGSR